MARREWALKIVGKQVFHDRRCGPMVNFPRAVKLVAVEHARAVRIVREVVKHAAHMERQTKVNREMNAYWQGKLDGAENILAGLRKGRA